MTLEIKDVSVRYGRTDTSVWPLRSVSFTARGGTTAITGPSGSGKSTLLRVAAGQQRPDAGAVTIGGQAVSADVASPTVGFIHQDYRLIPFLTVAENLRFAAEMARSDCDDADVARLLELVGLAGFESREPTHLSGGEQQRVAIARSLVSRPSVLLADEPTGALDAENTLRVARLFTTVAEDEGITVVVVTHDPLVAAEMARVLELRDGSLTDVVAAVG